VSSNYSWTLSGLLTRVDRALLCRGMTENTHSNQVHEPLNVALPRQFTPGRPNRAVDRLYVVNHEKGIAHQVGFDHLVVRFHGLRVVMTVDEDEVERSTSP